MKSFRFRAEGLLDLRRRQYDAVRAVLMQVTEAARQAAQRVADAELAHVGAQNEFRTQLAAGVQGAHFERHRNWIDRQQRIVEASRHALEEQRAAVAQAAIVVRDHFKGVRALERLRERAVRRYADDVRREEAKAMDMLAVLQYARRLTEGDTQRDG